MIATARGLAVLAAVAVALLVASFVAGPRQHAAVDRALVPGFDATHVTKLSFTAANWHDTAERAGTQWRVGPRVADPAAIDGVLTALRGARWHRRANAADIGVQRTGQQALAPSVTFDSTTLTIGPELPGTQQTWIVRGSDAFLVDNWVASALTLDPLKLVLRHPLDCTAAKSIVAVLPDASVRIAGNHLLQPRDMWLDDHALRALADACAAIETQPIDGQRDNKAGLRITVDSAEPGELIQVGTCAHDRVLVDSRIGPGSVDAAALRTLEDALRALAAAPLDALELRPLPIDPDKLTLQDGTALTGGNSPRLGDADADPERVRELVRALTTRGESAVARPAGKPTATITATDRAGTQITLELFAQGHLIVRAGEPGAIRVRDADWAIVMRPASALRDTVRWREDATTISAVTLDNVTYKRGAVLGEWTREPAGKLDPALVEALVETLATVRAPAGPPPTLVAHHVRVTITPPAGAPTTHTLELGASSGEGCAARIDGQPATLPLPLCTAVVALASSR